MGMLESALSGYEQRLSNLKQITPKLGDSKDTLKEPKEMVEALKALQGMSKELTKALEAAEQNPDSTGS